MDEERGGELERIRASYPAGTLLDEARVPPYTLPDPMVCADGTAVTRRHLVGQAPPEGVSPVRGRALWALTRAACGRAL